MDIKRIYALNNLELKEFTNELMRVTDKMQDDKLDVEIQFASNNGNRCSALVIGRARWEVDK